MLKKPTNLETLSAHESLLKQFAEGKVIVELVKLLTTKLLLK